MEQVYQALYRKWRPRTFDDVVGQSHITETLKNQVATNHLSHAYLFTGTRGTGKTTCAKILARAVNCEHPVNGNPCNECPSCRGIENGTILDVTEMDAASNNSVDNIRDLRDEAIYTPAAVKKRVYIVDEVHMLSNAAFNALLKILEEPPEHLIFILATTELHKVPATILSRCQRFSFKRIQPEDIAGRLDYVAQQEGIDLTPDGSRLLARLADGALRDALSLLDQCAAAGGTIDASRVLDTLGLAGNIQTAHLMDAVRKRDASKAISLLDELYANGKDVKSVLDELISLARDLLIQQMVPGATNLLTGGYDEGTMRALSRGFTSRRLVEILDVLEETQSRLRLSSSPKMDAELALIRLCDVTQDDSSEGLAERVTRLEDQMAKGVVIQKAATESTPGDQSEGLEDVPPPDEPPPENPEEIWQEKKPAPGKKNPEPEDIWPELAEKAKRELKGLEAVYITPGKYTSGKLAGDQLTVSISGSNAFHVLNKDEIRELLERLAAEKLGRPITVKLQQNSAEKTDHTNSYGLKPDDKMNDLLNIGRESGTMDVKNE